MQASPHVEGGERDLFMSGCGTHAAGCGLLTLKGLYRMLPGGFLVLV